ncbi:MAG: hypothetical protein MUO34_07690 [Ignavibacteriaceae bacterium]|nr:hypothetical protein [Ignavibacteriaceae bacterium]
MKTGITFSLIIVSLLLCQVSLAQEPCSEKKVSVNLDEIIDDVYNIFQSQYPFDNERDNMLPGFETWQTEKDWQNAVHDYLFNFLQESNPSVNFISKGGDDCDYSFTYSFSIIAVDYVDTSISVVRTKTGYHARAKLATNNACGENRQIDIYFGKDLDLFQAIKNMIAQFGPIDRVLDNYEKEHLSPPRGPKILSTFKDRNYVSPLEDERKIEINLEVRNCKNEIVFEKSHGHQVELLHNTDRSELENNRKAGAAFTIKPGNPLIIGIAKPKTASIFYKLKKGIKPEIEEIEISTCGRDRKETKTIKININGLDIQVKPKKTEVQSSEKTSIDIYFNTVSPNGNKRPVVGKQLTLSVKGIVDGSVSPSKTVATDSEGKATLQYKAGEQDKQITIVASYYPKDYPESVQGKAVVKVSPSKSDAILTMTSRHLNEMTLDRDETIGNDHYIRKSNYQYDRKGTITLQLKKHSVIDQPMLPELWVYYMSESRGFDNWDIKYFDHRDELRESKSGGFNQKIREDAQISDVKLRTPDVPMMVIVAYDKKSKKAKRVMVQASFDIGYKMSIQKSTETESWLGEKTETNSNDESRTKNDSYFFQVAGEPVKDPAINKEFPSGCLVSGGDGKTTFTGFGKTEEIKPVKNNKYYDEERDLKTFEWSLIVNEKK